MKKLFWLALILLCGAMLPAQTFRGGIQGTVNDSQGAVVPEANVTVSNPDTGLTRSTKSDPSGDYLFIELPIGNYQLTATKAGFRDQTVKDVKVEVSGASRVDFHLQLPSAKEV